MRLRAGLLMLGMLGPLPATMDAQSPRPMSFVDLERLRTAGQPVVSPDGTRLLYTVSTLDWKEGKRYRHIFATSIDRGPSSARQLTDGAHTSESSPRWSADGSFIVFQSDREANDARRGNQLYAMRSDGTEARRITDAREGVSSWSLSRDGQWLVYQSGSEAAQLYVIPAAAFPAGIVDATPLTHHTTGVAAWQLTQDGTRVYFISPDTVDRLDRARLDKKFEVQVRNPELPFNHLWAVDLASKQERRLTHGTEYTVGEVTVSPNGTYVGFKGAPNNRYRRNTTEEGEAADLYLLDVNTGGIERLTKNAEIEESNLSFSPDGKSIAFAAPNDFTYGRFEKIYLRETAAAGKPWKKLAGRYDGLPSIGWWSNDGRTIYFDDGIRATHQIFALDISTNTVTQVTHERGRVGASQDPATGSIVVNFTDPTAPNDLYVARSVDDLRDRHRWRQVTELNPEVKQFALGAVDEISWKSKDGSTVGGILVQPVPFVAGRRYPLVVQIHGGPGSAAELAFRIGYGAQTWAGAGYVVFLPNYRGSVNYGERFFTEVSRPNRFFAPGYDDIMSGVDHLIAQGLVHPDSLAVLGLSAGGHYSNWILTHTTRFKAIATGAGAANWISMYAESDVQRGRQWYLGGKLPYDAFETYWAMSPLKYVKRARTPTLIEFANGDPRVPRVQGDELHMALRALGVPTEFLVYPGSEHSPTNPRTDVIMRTTELAWIEKWIRGKRTWLDWNDLLRTLPADSAP
jgi:dipeptidyl aminopeptidase/acylaminoacyl peptidase